MSDLKPYSGVRCMCLVTGCSAGAGCPHYTDHCKAHIAHQNAQPAQAGQVLTHRDVLEEWTNTTLELCTHQEAFVRCARWAEQAVLAKRVPMTEAEMLAAFAVAHPQDHADMQDGSPANAVERIGARNVYRRFERGIHAAERHHGIVGEKGGA